MDLPNWAKYITKQIKARTPLSGDGILVTKTDNGTKISLSKRGGNGSTGESESESEGGGGTGIYFASINSGSGLTYVANIYNKFSTEMDFTGIEKYEGNAEVKVPEGSLDSSDSLTAGQVYPVAFYPIFVGVDGETGEDIIENKWVIIEHVGLS